VHARRGDSAHRGHTDWAAIVQLYEGLCQRWSTSGAIVGRAAAIGEMAGPQAGLQWLGLLQPDIARAFQPFYATRAHLLASSGELARAKAAYTLAIDLCTTPHLRDWLHSKRDALV
jgi:RNA polymerase sigma-70 factor, ECF subfamily